MRISQGPAPGLAAWWLGTFFQLFQPELWPIAAYTAGAALGLLCLAVSHRYRQANTVLFPPRVLMWIGLWVLAFALTGWRACVFQQSTLSPALEGKDLWVTGWVTEPPQLHSDGIRFDFKVEQAVGSDDGMPVAVPDRLSLGWYTNGYAQGFDPAAKDLPVVKAGERWRLPVRLKRPHGLVNPGGFDAELWMWSAGVRASGQVRDAMPARRLAQTWRYPIERWRQSARDAIAQTVQSPRWAGQIAALLMGDQASILPSDWDIFRRTGIAHLMSISGLHITLWAWIAGRCVSHVWRHSDLFGRAWCLRCPAVHAQWWGGCCFALLYAVFSGWGVPAQRTVCMLWATSFLRWQACRWPVWERWMWSAAVVSFWDPWALLQPGFWLSFVAVGVLILMPQSAPDAATSPPGAWGWVKRGMAHVAQLWREQWWVTLGLLPLTLWLFQQVSVVGLLVNLVAIPWVTLVVTPLAFAGGLWSPFWQVCGLSLQVLMGLLEPLSSLPWAVWHSATPPWWLLGLGMWAAAAWLRWRKLWVRLAALACWSVMLCWHAPRPESGVVQLLWADIGQGNAVLVRTANHTLVFDTGPRFGVENDAGQRVLLPLLQTLGDRPDTLVLSHQDSDHTGGALSILTQYSSLTVWSSIVSTHWLSQRVAMQRCVAGQHWTWDGVAFAFVHPVASDYDKPLSPNARSCVLRITAQGHTVLLTADIEALQEHALIEREGDALKAEVLLVPHHGSKTSSTEAFIDTVNPRWAVFQHGYRNRYGHPAPVVVQRYAQRGIHRLYSPSCGAMHWSSDQPQTVRCQRDLDKRYWRFAGD